MNNKMCQKPNKYKINQYHSWFFEEKNQINHYLIYWRKRKYTLEKSKEIKRETKEVLKNVLDITLLKSLHGSIWRWFLIFFTASLYSVVQINIFYSTSYLLIMLQDVSVLLLQQNVSVSFLVHMYFYIFANESLTNCQNQDCLFKGQMNMHFAR